MVIELILTLLTTTGPIGSGLRAGTELIYESGGTEQAPWLYESVRVVPRAEFERCVVIVRRGQAERESCARGDTLFERRPSGEYAPARPIGPNMELEVRTAAGNVVRYATGVPATAAIDGRTVEYLPTVIVTRDTAGSTIRRLREHYAPTLLTALWGVFEEPESTGGWRTVREFSLAAIRGHDGPSGPAPAPAQSASAPAPLAIGETFTLASGVLGETRTINVYTPPLYGDSAQRLPVLYMPDGGIGEDFLHIAGLLQISALNGSMRPFLLVGIENTDRRRDLTGPTKVPEDRAIAPRVGGSAAFRRFIRAELMPAIDRRYPTTAESAIMGESLAGLFVVETFFLEPDLFDTYIAFDPSLWWNDRELVTRAGDRLRAHVYAGKAIYLASSGEEELAALAGRLAGVLEAESPDGLTWRYRPMPEETHGTIYHPAALAAFRGLFAP